MIQHSMSKHANFYIHLTVMLAFTALWLETYFSIYHQNLSKSLYPTITSKYIILCFVQHFVGKELWPRQIPDSIMCDGRRKHNTQTLLWSRQWWLFIPAVIKHYFITYTYFTIAYVILSGLVVIMLATGLKVHGFKPGWGRWICKGDLLRRGSKAVGPML
jgi:hypothetical protein